MSKTLDKLAERHPDKIEMWYRDSDGYWVELNKGWQLDGCHGVHEDTVADCLSAFKGVDTCDCADCA